MGKSYGENTKAVTGLHKESVYDSEISPIISQLVEICDKHNIAYLCTFDLGENPEEDGEHLACTSMNIEASRDPDPVLLKISRLLIS